MDAALTWTGIAGLIFIVIALGWRHELDEARRRHKELLARVSNLATKKATRRTAQRQLVNDRDALESDAARRKEKIQQIVAEKKEGSPVARGGIRRILLSARSPGRSATRNEESPSIPSSRGSESTRNTSPDRGTRRTSATLQSCVLRGTVPLVV